MKQNAHHQVSRRRPLLRRAGFTIVEAVVTFIIISILALILTPTIANRAQDAKVTAATRDIEHLADAEARAVIDTGYYVRMYVLNDTGAPGDGFANTDEQDNRINSLYDNRVTTDNIYENPFLIFISPNTQNYEPSQRQVALLTMVESNQTWNGPYIEWHRDGNDNDWPDDPWGNDYLFFTKVGVLYPPPLDPQSSTGFAPDVSDQFQPDGPETGTQDEAVVFDRFAIVSLGPNGVRGDGLNVTTSRDSEYGGYDDIVRLFGGHQTLGTGIGRPGI